MKICSLIIMTCAAVWMSLAMVLVQQLHSVVVEANLVDTFTWVESSTSLPKPLSDMTATYMNGKGGSDTNGFIILFGGCDSPNGNQRDKSQSQMQFYCLSVTNSTFLYDPYQNSVTKVKDAPNPRYRHVAVSFNEEIYMLGGRDLADNFVTAIDVYNPYNDSWTTRGHLPSEIVTSDAVGWSTNDFIYYAGGYDVNYTAKGDTFRLDVSNNPTNFTEMAYKALSSMNIPRGDFSAEVAYGAYAYIVGGTSDITGYCESMKEVERYDIASNKWDVIAPLNNGVDDSAVAFLRGKIITVGGETKVWDCLNITDPAYGAVPDNAVEALDASLNNSTTKTTWNVYSDFPFTLMRFDAVAVPPQGRIYTFGGQKPYDETCQCFPAVSSILYGTESFSSAPQPSSQLSPGAIAGISIAAIIGAGIIIFGGYLFWKKSRMDKEYSSSD